MFISNWILIIWFITTLLLGVKVEDLLKDKERLEERIEELKDNTSGESDDYEDYFG